MANPKRRHSQARGRKRRTHQVLTAPKLVSCKQCHAKITAHTVCAKCGHYNGRLVVASKEK